jgi:hypothetical protein
LRQPAQAAATNQRIFPQRNQTLHQRGLLSSFFLIMIVANRDIGMPIQTNACPTKMAEAVAQVMAEFRAA